MRKNIPSLLLFALGLHTTHQLAAQTEVKAAEEPVVRPMEGMVDADEVHTRVAEMPEFPGGHQAMMTYLSRNLVYPEEAVEEGVEGRVMVRFVVERDGSLGEVGVVRRLHASLDREAIRVVKRMPKWSPGVKDDRPVRVLYNLPVTFKLMQDE